MGKPRTRPCMFFDCGSDSESNQRSRSVDSDCLPVEFLPLEGASIFHSILPLEAQSSIYCLFVGVYLYLSQEVSEAYYRTPVLDSYLQT